MKNACEEAEGLESAKKCAAIVGVACHTNERTLADYEEVDEADLIPHQLSCRPTGL